jgi:hypothetical protein
MKIAICLHGESRTWEKCLPSLDKFFKESGYEIYYFGHTWTINTWKRTDGSTDNIILDTVALDAEMLLTGLRDALPFADLKVDSSNAPLVNTFIQVCDSSGPHADRINNYPNAWNWAPMSYSTMYCNHLKRKYEMEHNMIFDAVVSTRFDVCFNPATDFRNNLPHLISENTIYTLSSIFYTEFMQHAIDDVFYFGSSSTIDTIDSFYRIYQPGHFFTMLRTNYYDSAYKNVGYGVLLYKWATMKNIGISGDVCADMVICRLNTRVNDTIADYKIVKEENEVWRK